MIGYQFSVRSGVETENLGAMACANDNAAIAFGKQTINDLMKSDAKQYAPWIMDITDNLRVVSSISFFVHPGRTRKR